MFLNVSALNKLIKHAYKTKLILACVDEGLMMHMGTCIVWLDYAHVPNKIKGTIMELAGELPVLDSIFEVSKTETEPKHINDEEMIRAYLEPLMELPKAKTEVKMTPVIVCNELSQVRVLKLEKEIIGISNEIYSMIDINEIDHNQESKPEGPVSYGGVASNLHWHNEICKVIIPPTPIRNKDLAEQLAQVIYYEEPR